MVRIKGEGHLSAVIGVKELKTQTLREALEKLSEIIPDLLDSNGNPSGNYIVLLNNRDVRLFPMERGVGESDVLVIIPVSHGG